MPSQRAPRADTAESGRENVLCGVDVRMRGVPAGYAAEAGPTPPRVRISQATAGAGLARVGGVDLDKAAPRTSDFVGQHAPELTPTLTQDRPIQTRLRSHVVPRRSTCSARRTRHRRDPQSLEHNCLVRDSQALGQLVKAVATPTSLARSEPRDSPASSLAPLRAPLLPFAASLKAEQPLALAGTQAGHRMQVSIRERNGRDDAEVRAHRRSRRRIRLADLPLAAEGDVPSQRLPAHGDVLDLPARLSRPAKANPAKLRDAHSSPPPTEALHADSAAAPLLDAEALTPALAAWARMACRAGEEVAKGPVNVAQGLLENVSVRVRKPGKCSLQFRQLSILRRPVDTLTVHSPCEPTLFESSVVDSASTSGPTRESRLLSGRRIQPVAKGRVVRGRRRVGGSKGHIREHMFATGRIDELTSRAPRGRRG
jgi:hypothetical protein